MRNSDDIKELTQLFEEERYNWARNMINFLTNLNTVMVKTGGKLSESREKKYRRMYRKLLISGHIESSQPYDLLRNNRGKSQKPTKSQELLKRFKKKEDQIFTFRRSLRFSK